MGKATISGSAVDLDRSLFLRGDITAIEILDFLKAWDGLASLQTCRFVKSGVFELTFHQKESAFAFEDLGPSFIINGKKVEQRPANGRRKKIRITGLPGSFQEGLLRKFLQEYGSLDSLTPELFLDYSSVQTGVWIAVISSDSDPPPLIQMGDYSARTSFAGQKRLCWDCLSPSHGSGKCPRPKCRICSGIDHFAASCPDLAVSRKKLKKFLAFDPSPHPLPGISVDSSASQSPSTDSPPHADSGSQRSTDVSSPTPSAASFKRKKKKGKNLRAPASTPACNATQTRTPTAPKILPVSAIPEFPPPHLDFDSVLNRYSEVEECLLARSPSDDDYDQLHIEYMSLETFMLEQQGHPWFRREL